MPPSSTDFASPLSLDRAVEAVRERVDVRDCRYAFVLGSGLGGALPLEQPVSLPYAELDPRWPAAVSGHAGCLFAGHCEEQQVLIFSGRLHCYQGLSAYQAAFPVRLAAALGVTRLVLTNAAGGIHDDLSPGSLMFVNDHLNLLGDHPLRGSREEGFLDLSRLYRRDLYPSLQSAARDFGIDLRCGVLAAVPGPTYETPAEVRMLRTLGADAVSMSTIPEALQAAAFGMEVVGLSLISNRAAGLASTPLSHEEVLAAAHRGGRGLSCLLRRLIRCWPAPLLSS